MGVKACHGLTTTGISGGHDSCKAYPALPVNPWSVTRTKWSKRERARRAEVCYRAYKSSNGRFHMWLRETERYRDIEALEEIESKVAVGFWLGYQFFWCLWFNYWRSSIRQILASATYLKPQKSLRYFERKNGKPKCKIGGDLLKRRNKRRQIKEAAKLNWSSPPLGETMSQIERRNTEAKEEVSAR